MFTKTILSAWIAAGLMLSAQTAAAQTAEAQSAPAQAANTLAAQRLVHYADLDLTSAKGQATPEARLRSAARAVCDTSYGAHSLKRGDGIAPLLSQRLAVRPARGGQPDEPPDWEPLIGALSC